MNNRGVLDTSVIVKSIFTPPKSLSRESYKRELETHEKCRFVIKKIVYRIIAGRKIERAQVMRWGIKP